MSQKSKKTQLSLVHLVLIQHNGKVHVQGYDNRKLNNHSRKNIIQNCLLKQFVAELWLLWPQVTIMR